MSSTYSGELVCTPGPASIDSSAVTMSVSAGSGADAWAAHNQTFVETRPPPLVPQAGDAPLPLRVPIGPVTAQPQTLDERFKRQMAVIRADFPRIHNAIESMWGTHHCSKYMQTLILNGGSGDDRKNTRVGFNVGVFTALMMLYELHDNVVAESVH